MNSKGRYQITEDDSQEKRADDISFSLREISFRLQIFPEKDLVAQVVRIMGNKTVTDLLMKTAKVEQTAGLFIMNASQRKTPGGVFLDLLKSTPSVSEE